MSTEGYVEIPIDDRERALLLSLIGLDPVVEKLLRAADGVKGPGVLGLTPDMLDDLLGAVAFEANHTENTALQKQLDRLYGRLEELLDAHLALGETESGSKDDRADALAQLLEMLGVPSPAQTMALVCSDWEDPNGAVQINHQLAPSDVKHVDFLANARILLRAVREAGGVKATAAGNLNRKFVGETLDVVGPCGGFNLHFAFATGAKAGWALAGM